MKRFLLLLLISIILTQTPKCQVYEVYNEETQLCEAVCEQNQYYNEQTNDCEICQEGDYYNPETKQCEEGCPIGEVFDENTQQCVGNLIYPVPPTPAESDPQPGHPEYPPEYPPQYPPQDIPVTNCQMICSHPDPPSDPQPQPQPQPKPKNKERIEKLKNDFEKIKEKLGLKGKIHLTNEDLKKIGNEIIKEYKKKGKPITRELVNNIMNNVKKINNIVEKGIKFKGKEHIKDGIKKILKK